MVTERRWEVAWVERGWQEGGVTEFNKGTSDVTDLLTTLIVITGPQWDACVQTGQNLPYCTLKYALFIVYQFCLIRLWNICQNSKRRLVKSEMLKRNKQTKKTFPPILSRFFSLDLLLGSLHWEHRVSVVQFCCAYQ